MACHRHAARQDRHARTDRKDAVDERTVVHRNTIINEPWELPNEYIYSNVFNMYDDLRDKLIEGGIKPEQIAYIHDAKTDEEKDSLFASVRAGRVRVLIGSTQKMGEGTNVQARLKALHNLDIRWTPAEMKQRMGRILRSGNMFDEVEIHNYVTKKSQDANSWYIVGTKNRLISQVLNVPRTNIIDTIDGDQVSTEETIAAIMDDPRIMARVNLERMLTDARMFFDMARDEKETSEKRLESARKQFEFYQKEYMEDYANFTRVAKQRAAENAVFSIVDAKGVRHTNNAEFFSIVRDAASKEPPHQIGEHRTEIGRVFGSPVELQWSVFSYGDGSLSSSAALVMPELHLTQTLSTPKWGEVSLTEQDIINFKTKLTNLIKPVSEKNATPNGLAEREKRLQGEGENVASLEEALRRATESMEAQQKSIDYAEPRYTAVVDSLDRSKDGSDESQFIAELPELLKGDPTKGPDDDGPDGGGGGGGGGGDQFFGDVAYDGGSGINVNFESADYGIIPRPRYANTDNRNRPRLKGVSGVAPGRQGSPNSRTGTTGINDGPARRVSAKGALGREAREGTPELEYEEGKRYDADEIASLFRVLNNDPESQELADAVFKCAKDLGVTFTFGDVADGRSGVQYDGGFVTYDIQNLLSDFWLYCKL